MPSKGLKMPWDEARSIRPELEFETWSLKPKTKAWQGLKTPKVRGVTATTLSNHSEHERKYFPLYYRLICTNSCYVCFSFRLSITVLYLCLILLYILSSHRNPYILSFVKSSHSSVLNLLNLSSNVNMAGRNWMSHLVHPRFLSGQVHIHPWAENQWIHLNPLNVA